VSTDESACAIGANSVVAAASVSCEHGRQKQSCTECGGTSICQHKRQRNGCKECKKLGCGGQANPHPSYGYDIVAHS
jgi:hypothetical protein